MMTLRYLNIIIKDWYDWSIATFGDEDMAMRKKHHLKEEITELIKVDHSNKKELEAEYADCFILLLTAARADGYIVDDLIKFSEAKMKINKKRKWGNPKLNGVVNHIKQK